MKFVSKMAALIAALTVTSVAMAQVMTSQKNVNQVGEGDTSVLIENVKGKPGTAIMKTSGLKLVVLSTEKAPEGYKIEATRPDDSDKSINANLGTFAENQSLAGHTLCWRGIGRKGWGQMSCSKVGVNGSARHQLATDVRGEVMAFTPELRNAKGEHVAWVSHPGEVRRQLHCEGKSQQASVFYVDGNGNWRPATLEETAKYDQEEYGKACKDAA